MPVKNDQISLVAIALISIFTIISLATIGFSLCGCTYSITMVHTAGEASDVVDETATNSPSTSVSVPVSVVPKPTL